MISFDEINGNINNGTSGSTQTSTNAAPQFSGGPVSSKCFFDLATSMSGTDSLSPEAQGYLEKLGKALNPEGVTKIDIRPCPGQTPALTYLLGKYAIVLSFAEGMTRSSEYVPLTVTYEKKIRESFLKTFGNEINLLNVVLVTKPDYENRHMAMAGYIRATLEMANDESSFQSFDFLRGADSHFVCYTDTTFVRDIHARWSPHAVADRCDFGFVLGVRQNDAYGNSNANESAVPVAVVTGYNEFRQTQANFGGMMPGMGMMGMMGGMAMPTVKFNQLVHISSIVTRIPSRRLLMSLILPAAQHVFIQNMLCRQRHLLLGQGADVCSLVTDPNTGMPYRAETVEQVQAFFQTMCFNPVLVVDVQDGRARIPGIEALANQMMHGRIIDDLSSFLHVQFPNTPVGSNVSAECGGTVRIRGNDEDVRNVDFFHMLEVNKELATTKFLNRPMHATDRFKEIAALYQNGESNNYGLHVLMDGNFMNSLMNAVGPQLKLVTDMTSTAAGFMDTNILAAQAMTYGGINTGFASPINGMGSGVFGMPNVGRGMF